MRANVKVIRDTDTSMIWTVRFVEKGDRYGLKDCLINNGLPLVEFYDARFDHTDFGQFVSRYHVETLLEEPWHGGGLSLDGRVPAWTVSARCMKAIREWLAEQVKEAA
jgi:hypothetical protein